MDDVTTIGSTECFVFYGFQNTLLPQSLLEKSNLITILADKQLRLIDSKSTLLKDLLAKHSPIILLMLVIVFI